MHQKQPPPNVAVSAPGGTTGNRAGVWAALDMAFFGWQDASVGNNNNKESAKRRCMVMGDSLRALIPASPGYHSMPTPSSAIRTRSLMPRRCASISRRSSGSVCGSLPSKNVA
jgi:hypothetical protein